jgi:MFS family permease
MGRVSPPSASTPPAAPAGRDPRRPWAPTPFMRLARAHAAAVSGDALFAIGLAGSVFFSLDFNSARWRVALYLVLTIAPFAVAAPLIGPAIDRVKGGRRWIIVGSMAARSLLCILVVRHMQSLLFYPEAFGMLVVQKVYSISKSAVVPGTVRSDEELVEANSKLTVLSALAVVVAAIPGGILLKLGGGGWSVALGVVVYGVGTVLALQMPPTTVAPEPVGEVEKQELRSAGIVAASSAMGSMRGIVGFLSFMLAFAIKEHGALWELGLVAVAAQVGFFFGAVAAPRVRKLATEEHIIAGALVVTGVVGVITAVVGGLLGAAMLSMTVGATGSAAKQAFDSIVQRDAPDANRGRSFARFETRFQLVWVIGALIPIVIPIPADLGFAIIAIVASAAVITYWLGIRRIRQGKIPVKRQIWRRRSPAPPEETGLGVALDEVADDATVVAGPSNPPAPAPPTASSLLPPPPPPPPPAPVDPTVVVADATVVTPLSASDPARRWMRPGPTAPTDDATGVERPAPVADTAPVGPARPPSPSMPGSVPLPFPDVPPSEPTPPASAGSAPPAPDDAPDDNRPPHRREGLLFGPEAWDDATTPPAPDSGA